MHTADGRPEEASKHFVGQPSKVFSTRYNTPGTLNYTSRRSTQANVGASTASFFNHDGGLRYTNTRADTNHRADQYGNLPDRFSPEWTPPFRHTSRTPTDAGLRQTRNQTA